jgi:L-2-hydroxyglutarate oxidase LhgO
MDSVDCVVVGAGVVGLAIARSLALAGREVFLLESSDAIGTGTSSRNSEVIHAGIYYPTDSLMARSCVDGKNSLYEYCAEKGIEHRACGKLIVAISDDDLPKLDIIKARAAANGVHDLRILTQAEAQQMEPALKCVSALFSPSTGIIDSHAYMLALQGDFEAAGGVVAFHSRVTSARATAGGIEIRAGEVEPLELRCNTLINAAGLYASELAGAIAGMPAAFIPETRYAKGNYFTLQGRAPFSRLIYPAPVPGGLGIHLTLDLGGQARFGPDVEWVDHIDYAVDPSRGEIFYEAVRRYWPDLPDAALHPGYAGIRPKITPPGAPAADFIIQGPDVHGVPGLINLFGIESPGLTASLALAELVRSLTLKNETHKFN